MARAEIHEVVLTSNGTPLGGASVQVNVRSGGAATVYQSESGGTTVANPILTDAQGRIEGWLDEGSYDLVVSGTGITTYTQRFEAVSGASTPAAHQARHQAGGADVLSGNLDATARVAVKKAGTTVGTRRGVNFIEGSRITLTVADDATNEEVDVTVATPEAKGAIATKTADQSPGALSAIVTFDAEEFDNDTIHDNATNNSRLTVKTAGVYTITALARLTTQGQTPTAKLRKNGVDLMQITRGTDDEPIYLTHTVLLAVNDYIELFCDNPGVNNITIRANSRLAMFRVSGS